MSKQQPHLILTVFGVMRLIPTEACITAAMAATGRFWIAQPIPSLTQG